MGMSCIYGVSDRQVRFDCIFTGFADNRLWNIVFLIQKCMLGTKVSCFSVDFPFVLAP